MCSPTSFFLYLPVSLIPLFSFNNSIQAAFPLKGFTLDWYATLFGNSALSGALCQQPVDRRRPRRPAPRCAASRLPTWTSMAARRWPRRSARIARLPILIPGVIVGISLLILVNLAGFGPSRIAIVLGHMLVALPTTVVIMRSRFAAIPKSIPEAALDLGASRLDRRSGA